MQLNPAFAACLPPEQVTEPPFASFCVCVRGEGSCCLIRMLTVCAASTCETKVGKGWQVAMQFSAPTCISAAASRGETWHQVDWKCPYCSRTTEVSTHVTFPVTPSLTTPFIFPSPSSMFKIPFLPNFFP